MTICTVSHEEKRFLQRIERLGTIIITLAKLYFLRILATCKSMFLATITCNLIIFFSLLQRTSVVSSSVEWQNGCAIQKQSRYDRAQRAHHKEGEILAELCTGFER